MSIRVKHENRVTSFEGKHVRECARIFCSLTFSFVAFKMSNEEKPQMEIQRTWNFF